MAHSTGAGLSRLLRCGVLLAAVSAIHLARHSGMQEEAEASSKGGDLVPLLTRRLHSHTQSAVLVNFTSAATVSKHENVTDSINASLPVPPIPDNATGIERIPRVCHIVTQGPGNNTIPPNFTQIFNTSARNNPDVQFVVYDPNQMLKYIKDNFEQSVAQAYEAINPNLTAAKIDMFRYCVLYQMGGIYLDIDKVLQPGIFQHYILPTDRMLLNPLPPSESTNPQTPPSINTSICLISEPGHPYLDFMIRRIVREVLFTPVKQTHYSAFFHNASAQPPPVPFPPGVPPAAPPEIKPRSLEQNISLLLGGEGFAIAVRDAIASYGEKLHRELNYTGNIYADLPGVPQVSVNITNGTDDGEGVPVIIPQPKNNTKLLKKGIGFGPYNASEPPAPFNMTKHTNATAPPTPSNSTNSSVPTLAPSSPPSSNNNTNNGTMQPEQQPDNTISIPADEQQASIAEEEKAEKRDEENKQREREDEERQRREQAEREAREEAERREREERDEREKREREENENRKREEVERKEREAKESQIKREEAERREGESRENGEKDSSVEQQHETPPPPEPEVRDDRENSGQRMEDSAR